MKEDKEKTYIERFIKHDDFLIFVSRLLYRYYSEYLRTGKKDLWKWDYGTFLAVLKHEWSDFLEWGLVTENLDNGDCKHVTYHHVFNMLPFAQNYLIRKGFLTRHEYEVKLAAEEFPILKDTVDFKNRFLLISANDGCSFMAKLAIDKGANVDAKTEGGYTALMFAAGAGLINTTQALIEAGADVNIKNNTGETALIFSAREIPERQRTQSAEHIKVICMEITKSLIDAGADTNVKDKKGFTALMYSEQAGQVEVVDLLKKAGARE